MLGTLAVERYRSLRRLVAPPSPAPRKYALKGAFNAESTQIYVLSRS
jgi:hypothetical protein